MTSEEIVAELRERGLPVDILPFLLNPEDEVLDPGEDPDPYGLMKNVTPASTNGSGEASGDSASLTRAAPKMEATAAPPA